MKKILTVFAVSLLLCVSLSGCNDTSSKPVADSVVVSSAPASPLNVKIGVITPVVVTFATSDNSPLAPTKLTINDLGSLPAGWTQTGNTCVNINSTTSSCHINLSFSPSVVSQGNISLTYSYNNQSSSYSLAYTSTANNNARSFANPLELQAISGFNHSYPVTINFTTDDGNPATNLTIPSVILPTGWKFTNLPVDAAPVCKEFGAGQSCALQLTYTPTTRNPVSRSTLIIPFNYIADDGQSKTDTVQYIYSAGTDNAVLVSVNPTDALNTHANTTTSVTLRFTTNDSNPASNFSLVPNLSGNWSIVSPMRCPGVANQVPSLNSGLACTETLQYAPTVSQQSDPASFEYFYSPNDRRTINSVTFNISATSLPPFYAYALDQTNNKVWQCLVNADGSVSSDCQSTALPGVGGSIVFKNFGGLTYAYITSYDAGGNSTDYINQCTVHSDGTLNPCVTLSDSSFNDPYSIAFNSTNGTTYAYVANYNQSSAINKCTVNTSTGTFSNCGPTIANTGVYPEIVFKKMQNGTTYAYAVSYSSINICKVDSSTTSSGGFISCQAPSDNSMSAPSGIEFHHVQGVLKAYVSAEGSSVYLCDVNQTTGDLSSCNHLVPPNFYDPMGISIRKISNDAAGGKSFMYVSNLYSSFSRTLPGSIAKCLIGTDGLPSPSSCNLMTNNNAFGQLTGISVYSYSDS